MEELRPGLARLRARYVMDMGVDVAFLGAGVGAALLGGAGVVAAREGRPALHLHVRRRNPGVELYARCGFAVTEAGFPSWYDWHGGYAMEARAGEVAAVLDGMPHVTCEL